ncbi:MAG: potassium-transporting ATPase subunit F [Bacteroidales bacterium]|nr:potassium-transporting ATPase subunit F [Bacteroidales bacterium]
MKTIIVALFLTLLVATGIESESSSSYILALILAISVLAYLVYSLVKPQKF